MWVDRTIGYGWTCCWHEDGTWWFFGTSDYQGLVIHWLVCAATREVTHGALAPYSSPWMERGQWHYDTDQERDAAWDQLCRNPLPFMLRAVL